MNDLEFSFEPSPWQVWLRTKQMGDSVSAAELLTLLEDESEDAAEDALQELEMACMAWTCLSFPAMWPPVRQLPGFVRNSS